MTQLKGMTRDQALDAVRKQGVISILSLIQPSPVPINLHLNTLKEISSVGTILVTNEFDAAVGKVLIKQNQEG